MEQKKKKTAKSERVGGWWGDPGESPDQTATVWFTVFCHCLFPSYSLLGALGRLYMLQSWKLSWAASSVLRLGFEGHSNR